MNTLSELAVNANMTTDQFIQELFRTAILTGAKIIKDNNGSKIELVLTNSADCSFKMTIEKVKDGLESNLDNITVHQLGVRHAK